MKTLCEKTYLFRVQKKLVLQLAIRASCCYYDLAQEPLK